MDDFKETLIYVIKNSKAESATKLMMELMPIFYASAFADGQRYIVEREQEE